MSQNNEIENQAVTGRRFTLLDAVLLASAAGAFLLAGYLSYQVNLLGSTPPGYGEASGCGTVLSSKYSKVAGISSSVLAMLAYGGLILLWPIVAGWLPKVRAIAQFAVIVLASAITLSALWFVALQLLVLHAICVYCMTDHAMGLIAASMVFTKLCVSRRPGSKIWISGIGVGVLAVTALILIQLNQSAELGRIEGVVFELDSGSFELQVAENPHVGPTEHDRLMLLMFDYACPHCKTAHDLVLQERESAGLTVVLLSIAIWPDCNDQFTDSVNERFSESCELAELALAVYQVNPEAFMLFDTWLYAWESNLPRTAAQARAKAEQLVGAESLSEALSSGKPAEALARNIELFQASGAHRVPVVLIPGKQPVVGKIEDFSLLTSLLTEE